MNNIFQIAQIDEDGRVRDIHRTDWNTYSKRITNLRDGKRLNRLMIVITGAETGGGYRIDLESSTPAPDVMVTRWHSQVKKEYEIDSRNWAWTWVSPDIWVDNDGDGVADSEVYFNYDNQLHVRLHNKGNLNASGIQVAFHYQDASGGLTDGGWLPVLDRTGALQVLTGLSLAPGASAAWLVAGA